MKKIALLAIALIILLQSSFGQFVDDGYVTNILTDKYNHDSATSFVMAFNKKFQDVRKASPPTKAALAYQIGFSPDNLVSLESLQQLSLTDKNCKLSPGFLSGMINLRNRTTVDFVTIGQVRDEIKRMALQPGLNNSEGTTLALMDLSIQQLVNSLSSDFASRGEYEMDNSSVNSAGPDSNYENNNIHDLYALKLPRWIRCGLFVIGSGIVGAGGGIVTGAQVGTFVGGPPGAVIGAVVGGIIGGVTGLIGGAIAGCE